MNKLAKIQHKIIELVVSSSAVPKAKASEVFHLTPSSSSVNCLARFHFTWRRTGSNCHHLANYHLLCQDKKISIMFQAL